MIKDLSTVNNKLGVQLRTLAFHKEEIKTKNFRHLYFLVHKWV